MSSDLKMGRWGELLFSSLGKLTWARAALGTLGIALLIVLIWPHARLVVEIVTVATIVGALSAAVCGLTFWAKARVQMGRRKLRYKDVRRVSAMVALVGLSFLAAQRSSLRLWPRDSADSTGFVVAVAPFENDVGHQVQNQLIATLDQMDPRLKIHAISLSRPIPNKVTQEELSKTAHQAQASAMLWGSVVGATGSRTVTLSVIAKNPIAGPMAGGGAPMPLELPVQDLATYVALGAASQHTETLGKEIADVLKPLIENARAMADDSKRRDRWRPDTRAQVDQVIGSALAISGQQTGSKESLETSLIYYHRALGEFRRESDPKNWAMAQSNLGTALRSLYQLDHQSAYLQEAIAAFREALKLFTLHDYSMDYVLLQSSIGHAFRDLGERDAGLDNLTQAVTAFRAALAGVTMKANPLTWAGVQVELGWTLRMLGDIESTSSDYQDATTADRAALTVFGPDSDPAQWAYAQTGLAQSLRALGERTSRPDYLRQSVSAYREILDHFADNAHEGLWVATQIGLGNALISLASYESDARSYEEAVAALRAALAKLSPDGNQAESWATAQEALGNALRGLGARKSNIDDLKQSVEAFNQALKVFTRDNAPGYWVTTKLNIGDTLADIGTLEPGTTHLSEAATTYREVLSALSEKDNPGQWNSTQEALKKTLATLRQRGVNES